MLKTAITKPGLKFASRSIAKAASRSFRGEVWEHNPSVPMGKGYANKGKPFDIAEACYLKPPLRDIRTPIVRKMVIRAAVQTLKTFLVEKCASYFSETDPGDMVLYDCDIEAANDHAKSRLGPLLKSMPHLSTQIRQAEAGNRFDVTTTEYYLPGMTLRVWPLNESSTQRITIQHCFISDAFLSKKSGMIKQAIARTTQHPLDKKIIIESQGSDAGDDFDAEWQTTNQSELHVVCPYCDTNQPFEWERERLSDFTPVAPKRTCEGSQPKAGTFSGMIRGDASPDRKKGEINARLVIENTHYECFHCGAIWRDIPEIRKALDESSNYLASNPEALPENVGFSWPFWINRRLKWGADEYGMLAYLHAKRLDREFGNRDPLKQWYQKRAAKTWDDSIGKRRAKVIIITDDSVQAIENEAARMIFIDCQQAPDLTAATGKSMIGHFWYIAWAVDKTGKVIQQLTRGYADSWQKWIDIRESLNIPDKNVAIDGGNWLDEVLRFAAKHWELGYETIKGKKVPFRHVWTVMRGNAGLKYRKGKDGIFRPFSDPSYYQVTIEINQQKVVISVPVVDWSTLAVKDILYSIRRGGEDMPKIHALAREKLDEMTRAREVGKCTYEAQITNEVRTNKNGKDIWVETNPNTHYNDDECMGIVQMMRGGLLGIPEVTEMAAEV